MTGSDFLRTTSDDKPTALKAASEVLPEKIYIFQNFVSTKMQKADENGHS